MASAPPTNELLAFVVPRGDVAALPKHVVRAPRALPVNGRTFVVPTARDPHRTFAAEVDLVVGPATIGSSGARGPWARVPVRSAASAVFGSRAFLSWVRTDPFPAVQALAGEPADDDTPLTRALAALPGAIRHGGVERVWQVAVDTGLARRADVDPDERARWADAAADELTVTVRPVAVTIDAPTDDRTTATGRWGFWPPSFW